MKLDPKNPADAALVAHIKPLITAPDILPIASKLTGAPGMIAEATKTFPALAASNNQIIQQRFQAFVAERIGFVGQFPEMRGFLGLGERALSTDFSDFDQIVGLLEEGIGTVLDMVADLVAMAGPAKFVADIVFAVVKFVRFVIKAIQQAREGLPPREFERLEQGETTDVAGWQNTANILVNGDDWTRIWSPPSGGGSAHGDVITFPLEGGDWTAFMPHGESEYAGLGQIPNTTFNTQRLDVGPGDGALYVDAGGFYPTTAQQAGSIWRQILRPSALTFLVDANALLETWSIYLRDLRAQLTEHGKTATIDGLAPRLGWPKANEKWDPAKPTSTMFESIRALMRRQSEALRTNYAAYCPPGAPALRNENRKAIWDQSRRDILSSREVMRIEARLVPDLEYRREVIERQKPLMDIDAGTPADDRPLRPVLVSGMKFTQESAPVLPDGALAQFTKSPPTPGTGTGTGAGAGGAFALAATAIAALAIARR